VEEELAKRKGISSAEEVVDERQASCNQLLLVFWLLFKICSLWLLTNKQH